MANRKPLVADTGQVEQLQAGDDLDIPLEARHRALLMNFRRLVLFLIEQGFEPPVELVEEAVKAEV